MYQNVHFLMLNDPQTGQISINSKMNKYIGVYIHTKEDYILFFLKNNYSHMLTIDESHKRW